MSKFDFSNVSSRAVPANGTADFVLYRIEGQPVLTVKPATEDNPSYMRAMLKGSREQMRRLKAGDLSPEMLEENRQKDRVLFPRYVVVGWKGILDAKGKAVAFSAEACAEFIQALPRDMFNELRDFCSMPDNFRPDDDRDIDPALADDIVGN